MLHRCQLLTGNSMILRDVVVNSPAGVSDVEMLPETITVRPVYVFADKANGSLQSIVKWTMNALKEAEENELTSKNVDIHLSSKDPSIRNLLGLDQQLWQRFKLSPTWLQTYLKESGNYGEVFEKYLGEESVFKIKRLRKSDETDVHFAYYTETVKGPPAYLGKKTYYLAVTLASDETEKIYTAPAVEVKIPPEMKYEFDINLGLVISLEEMKYNRRTFDIDYRYVDE